MAYAVYLGWVLGDGHAKGGRRILEGRTLEGRRAAWAVLVGFSAASLTFYKTVMYCMFFFPFFSYHSLEGMGSSLVVVHCMN